MKLLPVVILILFPGFSYSEEIKLRFFENEELPRGQSGCWYYQPLEEKQRGKIVAVGESADEAIYFIINGKKTGIGNWRVTYRFNGRDAEIVNYEDYH